MAPPKKFNLVVSIDPGASCTKVVAIYTDKEGEKYQALVLSPHYLEIKQSGLPLGDGLAREKRCWVECQGRTYAIGDLAKQLGGVAPFRVLKAESANIKIAGALAAMMDKLGIIGKKMSSIRLTYLLPPGEYTDREGVTSSLETMTQSFNSSYGAIAFPNSLISSRPEGFGVFQHCKNIGLVSGRSILLMAGHRNISMYHADDGTLVKQVSLDRGFNTWISAICDQTSGYAQNQEHLGSLVAEYCTAKQPNTGIFASILRRHSIEDRQRETEHLAAVILKTRGIFWLSVVGWLRENFDPNAMAVILAGGMSHVFFQELVDFFRPLLPDRQDGKLGKPIFLDRDLIPTEDMDFLADIPIGYRSRMIDVYCLLKYL